jgi:hypothetical protein
MSEGYCIETGGKDVGIIVRDEGERDFRFYSAVKAFNALEGKVFRNPVAAARGVREHAAQRSPRTRRSRIRTAG